MKNKPATQQEDYFLNIKEGEIADLHDGKEPIPLYKLWLEGKLTSPGAAQQGYWAYQAYLETMAEHQPQPEDEE
ncbi:hypothetical protein FWJ25_01680 [Marinobacter salinexigens]|uniref:Uncharacterized protein n=1 Tax=Marinobacter salinexigens TaxID=2919747 RepID=A0A5B0VPE0_9GAMM|nr:hypothetical protein [Marinobacter salinexigens]KAA1175871.1 hypothetical protein FWJ25_01680 [Marinobacter salinexigens]